MKFVEVSKSKSLKFQQPVLAKDSNDVCYIARLVNKQDIGKGSVFTFEVAVFAEDQQADGPTLITDVTHVAIL